MSEDERTECTMGCILHSQHIDATNRVEWQTEHRFLLLRMNEWMNEWNRTTSHQDEQRSCKKRNMFIIIRVPHWQCSIFIDYITMEWE